MITMSTKDLVRLIETDEYILPKDLLANRSLDELAVELEDIYKSYRPKLDNQPIFREKYMSVVSYLLVNGIVGKREHKVSFDTNIISYLLASPD